MSDYFLRLKHPTLAWNHYAVAVRFEAGFWQFSIEWQDSVTGFGSPFVGRFPSRVSAGRNGCFHLRDSLRLQSKSSQLLLWADEVSEFVSPSQLLLAL